MVVGFVVGRFWFGSVIEDMGFLFVGVLEFWFWLLVLGLLWGGRWQIVTKPQRRDVMKILWVWNACEFVDACDPWLLVLGLWVDGVCGLCWRHCWVLLIPLFCWVFGFWLWSIVTGFLRFVGSVVRLFLFHFKFFLFLLRKSLFFNSFFFFSESKKGKRETFRVCLVGGVEKWEDGKLVGGWKSGRIENI